METRRGRDVYVTGIILAAVSATAFGTLAIFAKLAYRHGAETVPLLAGRFTVAALLLVAYNRARGASLRIDRGQVIRLSLLGGIGYALESALYFAALGKASAAVVGLIFYSYPMWTSIAAIVTGLERFHPRLLVALVLATIGILLIFSLPSEGLAGPLLALAAAFAVTVYYLFAQIFVRGVDAGIAATYTALGAAVTLAGVSLGTGTGLPAGALPHAAALGLVTAIAFVCLYGAVVRIGSAKTSIAHMLEPVTIVVLAAWILGDDITSRVAIGAVFIVSALPILAVRGKQKLPVADG